MPAWSGFHASSGRRCVRYADFTGCSRQHVAGKEAAGPLRRAIGDLLQTSGVLVDSVRILVAAARKRKPKGAIRDHAVPDHPVHPLGSQARVLLASVFGPYAQDDQYGSRLINPMELFHNQVTRVQDAFSLRCFHRSWGLMLIQVNVNAPCTLLDFPSQERFIEEIKTQPYDIIGISSIIPNVLKVRRMCRLIRKHQSQATIVIGGHIANVPELGKWVDADHIVQGEGVRWMRRFLGEDESQPIRHPQVMADIGPRTMGVPLRNHPGFDDAVLIPAVGCPDGVQFLLHLRHVRRQGKIHRVLQDRR